MEFEVDVLINVPSRRLQNALNRKKERKIEFMRLQLPLNPKLEEKVLPNEKIHYKFRTERKSAYSYFTRDEKKKVTTYALRQMIILFLLSTLDVDNLSCRNPNYLKNYEKCDVAPFC